MTSNPEWTQKAPEWLSQLNTCNEWYQKQLYSEENPGMEKFGWKVKKKRRFNNLFLIIILFFVLVTGREKKDLIKIWLDFCDASLAKWTGLWIKNKN